MLTYSHLFVLQLEGLLCEYENIVTTSLSAIIVKEMKTAFDSLWTTVIVLKPPWTLSDAVSIVSR